MEKDSTEGKQQTVSASEKPKHLQVGHNGCSEQHSRH